MSKRGMNKIKIDNGHYIENILLYMSIGKKSLEELIKGGKK